jgi:hypothetical protein
MHVEFHLDHIASGRSNSRPDPTHAEQMYAERLSRRELLLGLELAAVVAKQPETHRRFGTVGPANPHRRPVAWPVECQIHVMHRFTPASRNNRS